MRDGRSGGDESCQGVPRERRARPATRARDRKSTRLNSSHANISYAVFCLKKKKKTIINPIYDTILQIFSSTSIRSLTRSNIIASIVVNAYSLRTLTILFLDDCCL